MRSSGVIEGQMGYGDCQGDLREIIGHRVRGRRRVVYRLISGVQIGI